MITASSEIVLFETAWWVVSRGRTWGPFDFQWSPDLRGIELLYRNRKFGEICGEEEFFADLAPFRIPVSVCQVAAIVAGTLSVSISLSEPPVDRTYRLLNALNELGYGRFSVRKTDTPPDLPADGTGRPAQG